MITEQKTYIPKIKDLKRAHYLINADNKILGKVATRAADILRGKNKAIFTPHLDAGDHVIVINAAKIKVSGKKMEKKEYHRYSGYPSGQHITTLGKLLAKSPGKVIELAVRRMVPKGALGSQVLRKLKVYAGDQHPHKAQKPITVEI